MALFEARPVLSPLIRALLLMGPGPGEGPEGEPQEPTPKPTPGVTTSETYRQASSGLRVPGNIDLYAQPKVKNPAGGTSTVYSFSVNLDGQEVLLPRVTPDGRLLSEAQAIKEYERTGRHLGIFDSPDSATRYAEQLHRDYEAGKYEPYAKPMPSHPRPSQFLK